MAVDEVFRLSELSRYIQQVFAINFESPFWIEAEIHQCSESRGNYYLDLIEKKDDSDEILARVQARIWRRNSGIIRRKLQSELIDFLQPGLSVKLRGNVNFHAVYGLSFIIDDIDRDFTIGEMERKKKEVIARLTADGLFEINRRIHFPNVPLRVAVISSRTAAGYADFVNQLSEDESHCGFQIDLYHCAVQGVNAAPEIIHALDEIESFSEFYDVVCLIRGGGSKLDLSAFDDENLVRRIAAMPLPVVTGIGHEIDMSVADMAAHTYLKTPTAVAGFLIEKIDSYFNLLDRYYSQVGRSAERLISRQRESLTYLSNLLETNTTRILRQTKLALTLQKSSSDHAATATLSKMKYEIDLLKIRVEKADPQDVLKRGFALIEQDDSIVKLSNDLKKKDISILMQDGKRKATIK